MPTRTFDAYFSLKKKTNIQINNESFYYLQKCSIDTFWKKNDTNVPSSSFKSIEKHRTEPKSMSVVRMKSEIIIAKKHIVFEVRAFLLRIIALNLIGA